MALLGRNGQLASQPPRRPPAAVELTPEGALAAALPGRGQAPVYAFASLPAGALVPGVAESNLHAPEAVAGALRSVLDQVSPRSRFVSLIVPDTAARVFVLDFDSLPSKASEAMPVLRFRLRKMVPFDVEHAALSYQVLAHAQSESELKVMATLMPGPIVAEYEAAVRNAGYEPGAVLPSSLAALSLLDSIEPTLAANLSGSALTTSITSGENLMLYRTVELPVDAAARLAEVQRSIAVAVAYYEDKLQARPRQLHYAGVADPREFAAAIADPELAVVEIAPAPSIGVTTAMGPVGFAGVSGALAGVA